MVDDECCQAKQAWVSKVRERKHDRETYDDIIVLHVHKR